MHARDLDANLVLGVAAVGVFLAWGTLEGGATPAVWYAGALLLLALLAVNALARPEILCVPRPIGWALGSFAAFTAWCFMSLMWADVPGDAWDGANRTLLYLIVYALFALVPWRPATAASLFGLFALATAGIGTVILVHASLGDPLSVFLGARFFEPLGYENANVAWFLLAFWPALFLAARHEVPVVLRSLFLGTAGVLIELALLGQSRGALFAFPAVLILYFALVPGRIRALIALIPISAVVALSSRPLLEVYTRLDEGATSSGVLDRARNAILVSFGVLVLSGLVLGLLDRRLVIPEPRARELRRRAGTVAIVAVAAAVLSVLVSIGNPVTKVAAAWDEFRAGPHFSPDDSSRFSNFGSNRYDIWRVAWHEFRSSPVQGVGVDNFATDHIRQRRTREEPRYPHSLELRVLAQTGIVGALLFGAFLVAAMVAAWRARSRQGPFERGLAGMLVIMAVYWIAHGSIDWFWEFPALTAPALAALAVAGRLGARSSEAPPPPRLRSHRLLTLAATAAVILFTLVSFVPPWLSARYVEAATRSWRAHPEASYEALRRARTLNFLSDEPDVFMGAIAARRHDLVRAEAAFRRALERNPTNWYAHLELGVLEAIGGHRSEALEHLRRANGLNPREPLIDLALERVTEGDEVTLEEIDAALRERVENRFGLDL